MARKSSRSDPIYVISVAAELAGVHPQTLRVYERKGLLRPERTSGNTRRYSQRDIDLLRRIQELTQEGVNLAGVVRILALQEELADMKARFEALLEQFDELEPQPAFPLVRFSDVRRIRRAMKTEAVEKAVERRVFSMGPIQDYDG